MFIPTTCLSLVEGERHSFQAVAVFSSPPPPEIASNPILEVSGLGNSEM